MNRKATAMAIITLTSDWGITGHYAAATKGAILRRMPDARIVDITHNISKYNLAETAFVVRHAFESFPEGSIHVIGVNSEASESSPHLVVCYRNHYFIGTDNGVFSLITDGEPDAIYEITTFQDSDYFTFPSRDVFAKVACHIAEGKPLTGIGSIRGSIRRLTNYLPAIEKDSLKGTVIYIDSYDNAITNITEDIFRSVGRGRSFTLFVRSEEVNSICRSYSDVPTGEIAALFGSHGRLEISINQGSAANLLGIEVYDPVRIEFV